MTAALATSPDTTAAVTATPATPGTATSTPATMTATPATAKATTIYKSCHSSQNDRSIRHNDGDAS